MSGEELGEALRVAVWPHAGDEVCVVRESFEPSLYAAVRWWWWGGGGGGGGGERDAGSYDVATLRRSDATAAAAAAAGAGAGAGPAI